MSGARDLEISISILVVAVGLVVRVIVMPVTKVVGFDIRCLLDNPILVTLCFSQPILVLRLRVGLVETLFSITGSVLLISLGFRILVL